MVLFAFTALLSHAQSADITENYWSPASLQALQVSYNGTPQINAHKADYYQLEFGNFHSELIDANDGAVIYLPIHGGEFQSFVLSENTTMSEGLKEKFPAINSFNIVSTDSRNVWGKMDVSHNGFRAMIFQPGASTLFIDPVFHNQTEGYMVYQKADFYTDKVSDCQVDTRGEESAASAKAGNPYNSCELNTYRLAVAASGEYTVFHGGNAEDAIAAQITTMNRVSGVYERDFSVTFTIVENNDLIVYENAATDPYTNGEPQDMIGENQANIDAVIGSGNYDIGHVFGTNSGGLAGLGVTCGNGQKARGVTGSGAPVNDPFDIDYVAHEMGHQFGGNHSFNNFCDGNRNPGTAVEPGSGSTIMAYAGICNPNVQSNSDDHFHGINMREIGFQISNNNCQVTTGIENNSPALADLVEEVYIPIGTPFVLTADGSDEDGDELTYCWEQMDNETGFTQPPAGASTGGPNFRSNSPILSPTRYFPDLQALANGGPFTWERIPTVEREMNFRVTARDNAPGGGCTQYDDLTVVALGDEPFRVIYPSVNGIEWNAFDTETILWEVANTTELPIDAQTVDVFLSINGGVSYDIQLANDTENDGELTIQVPNLPTDDAFIMVMNSAGTFFDISNFDFTINAIENGFYFQSAFTGIELCQDEEVEFFVELVEIGSFPEEITLGISEQPTNAFATVSQSMAEVGDIITVSLSNLQTTAPGVYPLTLIGIGTGFENEISYDIAVVSSNPVAAMPTLPENEAEEIETATTLSWEDNATVGMTYTVELASDEDFMNIVLMESDIEEAFYDVTGLESETTYFWRVSNHTACGSSEPSTVFEFTTYTCSTDAGADLPLDISAVEPNEIVSEIEITSDGIVADIGVVDIVGTHSQTSDLTFTLESPAGTEVVLTSSSCGLSLTIEADGDVEVSYPSAIAGTYASSGSAAFSAAIPAGGISSTLVQAIDGSANPEELCEAAVNGAALNGNIALIHRGNCTFVEKVLNAQDEGAIAVIIANNIPGDGINNMGGNSNEINIPAISISYEDGQTLSDYIGGNGVDFNFGFNDLAQTNEIPCPTSNGGIYTPAEPLSAFAGEPAGGIWKLKIDDVSADNGGSLTGWNLNICYTGDIVDGVYENDKIPALIFPNPTKDLLNVQFESNFESRISLMDIAGRTIESKQNNAIQTQFDLNKLADGIYFVKIEGAGIQSVYKIVKQ